MILHFSGHPINPFLCFLDAFPRKLSNEITFLRSHHKNRWRWSNLWHSSICRPASISSQWHSSMYEMCFVFFNQIVRVASTSFLMHHPTRVGPTDDQDPTHISPSQRFHSLDLLSRFGFDLPKRKLLQICDLIQPSAHLRCPTNPMHVDSVHDSPHIEYATDTSNAAQASASPNPSGVSATVSNYDTVTASLVTGVSATDLGSAFSFECLCL